MTKTSKTKRSTRIIAAMLCAVMLLSSTGMTMRELTEDENEIMAGENLPEIVPESREEQEPADETTQPEADDPDAADDPEATEEPEITEQPETTDDPIPADQPQDEEEPVIAETPAPEEPVTTEKPLTVAAVKPETEENKTEVPAEAGEDEAWLDAVLQLMEANYRKGVMPPAIIDADNYLSGIAPAAFLDSGTIDKAAFTPVGLPAEADMSPWNDDWSGYNVAGGFSLSKFPDFTDIDFNTVSVTVKDAPLVALGLIKRTSGTAEEKTIYIYYMTTDQNESEISAMFLPLDTEGTIKVNYGVEEHNLSYEIIIGDVTLDKDNPVDAITGISMDSIFGGTQPTVTANAGVSFDVTIPTGYTATVERYWTDENGDEQSLDMTGGDGSWPLGKDPEYKLEGENIIPNTSVGPDTYTLTANFNDTNIKQDRHYVVTLTEKNDKPQFSYALWMETENTGKGGRGASGEDRGWSGYSSNSGNIVPWGGNEWNWNGNTQKQHWTETMTPEEVDGVETGTYTFIWTFQTNTNDGGYILNGLALNGIPMEIPYNPETTSADQAPGVNRPGTYTVLTLADGATARLRMVRRFGTNPAQYVYTLTITGARANVTVTGGNFQQGNGADEYVPGPLTGVYADDERTPALQQYRAASGTDDGWETKPVSWPVVNTNGGMYDANGDGDHHGANIRFRLMDGYENPVFTHFNVSANTPIRSSAGKEVIAPNAGDTYNPNDLDGNNFQYDRIYGPEEGGWYYIRLERNDSIKTRYLSITATAVQYAVRYMPGDGMTQAVVGGFPSFDHDHATGVPHPSGDWNDYLNRTLAGGGMPTGALQTDYDDNNGFFYSRGSYGVVSIPANVPVDNRDVEEPLVFQYWRVLDQNGDPATDEQGREITVYPGNPLELSRVAEYGNGLGNVGGSSYNMYIIWLEAVWAAVAKPFTYEVHLRWVDKGDEENPEGYVHPIEGEDPVYRVIDSKITNMESDTVTINIDSADILNWLARNPTYSLYESVNYNYGLAPEYEEAGNVKLATPKGNYQYEVTNGGQINIWLKENRGALSFSKTVVGDNACNGTFDFTVTGSVTGENGFTGTVYAWPQNKTWAASNAIQIYFDKGVAKLKVNYENGMPKLLSEDGKDYEIPYGVTMFVPAGDWTIKEDLPAGSGYNPQVNGVAGSAVTVPVTAGVTESSMNAFVNTVKAYELKNAPVVQKKIIGEDADTAPGGEFTFKLMPAESDIDNVEIIGEDTISITIDEGDTEGEAKFGGVIFKAAGTYYFTIREESFPGEDGDMGALGGGYTPVKRARNWRVTVVNDNGILKVDAFEIGDEGEKKVTDWTDPEPDPVPIENTWQKMEPKYCYEPLKVTKVLTGRTLRAAGFYFEASIESADPPGGATLPGGGATATATNGSRGDVGFGWIEFTQAGTYTVLVSEVREDRADIEFKVRNDIDYDEHELRITYKVVQQGDKLVLDGEPVYEGIYTDGLDHTGEDPTTFTNAAFVELPIVVTKVFDGDKEWEDETFTATISITGGDEEHKDVEIFDTDPDVNGWRALGVSSKKITFTKNLNNPGVPSSETFDFRFMAEGVYTFTVQEDNDGLPGITYDDAKHLIVVTVTDANGKLAAAVTVDGVAQPNAALTLHNVYSTASVSIPVSAYKDLEGATLEDHQFSFVLEPWTEGQAPEPAGGRTRLNEADGDILWNITFRRAGEFRYKLYEQAGSVGGITYDTDTMYQVVVNVTKDEDTDALNAEVKYLNEDGSEIADPTRLHNGVPVFINYAYVDVPLNIYKILDGRDWEETDQFVIRANLVDGDGTYVRFDNNEEVKWPYDLPALTSADPLGSTLRFYRGGTYVFELTEVKGNIPGITYDTTVHEVKVVVKDAISRLSYEMTVDGKRGSSVTFTNYYGITPASVSLRANVQFQGGTLTSGMFKFELTGVSFDEAASRSLMDRAWSGVKALFADDAPAMTAVPMPDPDVVPGLEQTVMQRNNGAGLINFGTVTLDQPGVYTYTVKQIEPDGGWQDDIIYDRNTYTITVNVIRQGHLLVYEAYDEPLFINRLKEPDATPKPDVTPKPDEPSGTPGPTATPGSTAPVTGDNSHPGLWLAILTAGVLGLGGVVVRKRQRS